MCSSVYLPRQEVQADYRTQACYLRIYKRESDNNMYSNYLHSKLARSVLPSLRNAMIEGILESRYRADIRVEGENWLSNAADALAS